MKKKIFIIIGLILVDQIIKVLVVNTLGVNSSSITLIPNVLGLTYIENSGGAFGIMIERLFLIGLDILIIFYIIKLMVGKKYNLGDNIKYGLSLVLAGGTGNLIDRIFRGYVVDYIDVSKMFNFPVFNFADICIVIGVMILVVTVLINTVKSQENINNEKV